MPLAAVRHWSPTVQDAC